MAREPVTAGGTFLGRVVGAAALRAATYEDVEADRGATMQALAVVVLSGLAAGLGARGFGGGRPADIAFFTVLALAAWAAWAVLTYQLGARIMAERQTRADVGQLLRTLGFASAPGMIRVVGLVPELTRPVFVVAGIWMLLSMVVAVRQALDYRSTRHAVAVCVVGWLLAIAIALVIGSLFGPDVS
jgi:hypothetical protein